MLDCILDNKITKLVNTFVPTINNMHNQRLFGEYLTQRFENYIEENKIQATFLNIQGYKIQTSTTGHIIYRGTK